MTLTRDDYIACLEKRATAEDNQDVALGELAANRTDSRAQLGHLFDQAGASEKGQSKQIAKLFPGKEEKESGHVLLKVARELFDTAFDCLEGEGHFKTAAANYREIVFRGYVDELAKIGAWAGAQGGMLQKALQGLKPATGAMAKAAPAAGQAIPKTLSMTSLAQGRARPLM